MKFIYQHAEVFAEQFQYVTTDIPVEKVVGRRGLSETFVVILMAFSERALQRQSLSHNGN